MIFRIIFPALLLLVQYISNAQNDPFITTWQVDTNDQITIPLQSGTYNFDFQWTLTTNSGVQISGTHTNADGDFSTFFVFAGIYELEITGDFPHLRGYPVAKLLDVLQWGDVQWESMEEMFRFWPGSSLTALDTPAFAPNTSLFRMFDGASNFNEDLNHWNMSNVNNIASMFRDADNFNGNVSDWVVSNVTTMRSTFLRAEKFNQDVSGWDVSQVISLQDMFRDADRFNQAIGDWDVSNVTSFREMLNRASSFNQSLGGWVFHPDAIFPSTFSSTNFDCVNWSATIIGWNNNNPTLDSLAIGGANASFDTLAAVARDELIARGWIVNGNPFNGICAPCEIFNPACESFELFQLGGLNGQATNCWTNQFTVNPQWVVKKDNTSSLETGPFGAVDADQYIYLETSRPSSAGDFDILTSPTFNIASLSNPRLAFFYHMFGSDMGSLIYEISEDEGTTWVFSDTIVGQQQTSIRDPWKLVTEDLTAFDSIITIRFIGIAGPSFNSDIALDKICVEDVPLCGDFHSLRIVPPTDTTVILKWVSDGPQSNFIVSYGPEGTLPGQGTVVNTNADSLILTGLSFNEVFTAHVEGFCMSTPADVVLTLTTSIVNNDICDQATPIFCGDTINGDLINARRTTPFVSLTCDGDSFAYAGQYYTFIGNGAEIFLSTKAIDNSFSYDATVLTGTCNDLQCFDESFDFEFISDVDTQYQIFITSFNVVGGAFELIIECNECYDPFDVAIQNVTQTSAEVTWTPGNFATEYQIEFDTVGFDLGTGNIITGTTNNNPVSLINLTKDTDYEVYLFEQCNGQTSDTLGPFPFTTLCDQFFTAPYCEGFDNDKLGELIVSQRSCWSNTNSARPRWAIENNSTASNSTGPNAPQVGNRYIYLETSGGNAGDADTLTGPPIDISDMANAELSFFVHMFGSSMGTLKWEISQDLGSTFISLGNLVGQQQSSSSADWTLIKQDLAAFSGTIFIRFIGIRGNSFRSDMAIDEICVKEKICPETINISGNQSDRTFTASSNITSTGKVTSGLVTYRFGGELNLDPGFEVLLGAEFDNDQSNCAAD